MKIKRINIVSGAVKGAWVVEILRADGEVATWSVDSQDLQEVYKSIDRYIEEELA